jgi:histidinol-phosphatase (PHP family)
MCAQSGTGILPVMVHGLEADASVKGVAAVVLVDYHNHTPLCDHAEGEPFEYVRRAIALGIAEIGFSEHSPWMIQKPNEKLAPTDEEFARFVEAVQALQRQYNDDPASPIRVRLGIEMDYVPDRLDRAREYLHKYPWDYVIGSVHHLDSWGFDNPAYIAEFDRRDIGEVYQEYFGMVADMAATGFFDIAGHVDLIKKFGHRPAADLRPLYQRLASLIKRGDMVVELNTSGRDKEARECYPAPALLEALAAEEIPFTLGSDAHAPEQVGRYFHDARDLLLSIGVREIVAFERRRRRFIPL